MKPTLRLLFGLLLTTVVVLAAPGRQVPRNAGKEQRSTTYYQTNKTTLPAYKESESQYHNQATEVPYYTARPSGLNGITRQYWLAIEEVDYDYAPLGYDYFNGGFLNETVAAEWTVKSSNRIGSVYMKAVYREYEDGTYTNRITHEAYLGFVGPTIRAEVGDTIQITVRNMARFNFSFHVHGAYYGAASDGTDYAEAIGGKSIAPNQQYSYVFDIPERSGPGENDTSSIVWAYYSNVNPTDIYAGLVGPLIIYKKGILTEYGAPDPSIINLEVVTVINVADENQSNYFKTNVATYLGPKFVVDPDDDGFYESNKMHHINGFVYANLNPIPIVVNQTTRWYIIGIGTEVDIHTAHWHGSTVIDEGHRSDVIALLPATFKVVDLIADNAGQWLFHCHVTYHMMGGMVIFYEVVAPAGEHQWKKRGIEDGAPFVNMLP